MPLKRLAALVLGIASALLASGCASTTVTIEWRTKDPMPPPFTKVVALVVNATPGQRRAAEDEMVRQMKSGVGVAAYTFLPDEDFKDKEKLKTDLKNIGADGLVVLRLVASDKSMEYHPVVYRDAEGAYATRSGFYDETLYSGGYTTTTVTIRGLVSVYEVDGGKLLWSGSTTTTDPQNIQDLVSQVAGATREELRKEGMFK
jgi:hypothetical protein